MTISYGEKIDSRSRDENQDAPTAERSWWVAGTDDDSLALSTIDAIAPTTWRGLVLRGFVLRPGETEDQWTVTAKYDKFKKRETGDSEFEFDIGVQSIRQYQSLAVTAYAPSGQTAPDFNKAIGVSGDRIEGIDVQFPTYAFSETHYLNASDITESYKLVLFNLAAKVNNASFRGFASGECMFLGARGRGRLTDQFAVTFSFACSPNQTGLAVGSITGINKKGWEYLDILWGDSLDTTANWTIKKPRAAYVHKVAELGDFSGLGI